MSQENSSSSSPVKGYLESKSRIRVGDLIEAKNRKEKWAMLTSYDTISAKIFDQARIPCLLIGDSAAQTVLGYKSTLPVTVDELIPLARAVSSSCERALVIADLPFGGYQESPEAALRSATRFMKEAQVHGIKLEGGREYVEHVKLLTQAGIPVVAHLGFTPQSEHALSGFKIQGRGEAAIERLKEDAMALEAAGAFACALELIPSEAGRLVTESLEIPTIGIGAGPHTDAQILVWTDMAGFIKPTGKTGSGYMTDSSGSKSGNKIGLDSNSSGLELSKTPKFAKRYANLSEILYTAAKTYASEVSAGTFPSEEYSYK